jgi:hypothetical protein
MAATPVAEAPSGFAPGNGAFMPRLGTSHLLGIGVVVGERPLDLGNVEVEPFGHVDWRIAPHLDASSHVADGEAAPPEVGLVVEVRVRPGHDLVLL